MSVPRHDFMRGAFPKVCVRTGLPADGLVEARFRRTPAWVFLLILGGPIPFLIGLIFAGERIVGHVPVTRQVIVSHHRRLRLALAAAIAGLALALTALATNSSWLARLAIASVVTAAVIAIVGIFAWIGGRPDRSGWWVELTRVHPRFAQSLAQHAQTPSPDQVG